MPRDGNNFDPIAGPPVRRVLSLNVILAITALIISPVVASAADSPKLSVQFNDSGLSSIKWADNELLTSGDVHPSRLRINSQDVASDWSGHTDVFIASRQTLTQTYSWGKIVVAYHPAADRLSMAVKVLNTGKGPLTEVVFDLMQIQFPSQPVGTDWEHHYGRSCDRTDAIPAILADWGSGRLAVCGENPRSSVKFSVRPHDGQPYAIALQFDDKPIEAGSERQADLSIRLAGADHPGWSIVQDVLDQFAAKYPSELNWPDRRPIGSAFLATSVAGYTNNPRGWFLDHFLDTTTENGRAAFRDELMKYEDAVLSHCRMMNAQGVIVWDLEGQEMPHATSYLADPRMLPKVAPEMDQVADKFFKRLTDAGLRTGITIRPTRVAPVPDGQPGWTQLDVPDPIAEMDSKISYAYKRWGCTLFYCDSNVNFVRDSQGKILSDPAMTAEGFATLARHHKDCLLIPEHKTSAYWAYTAPYSELRLGIAGTPPEIRATYPHAFSVLRVVDGPPLDSDLVIQQLTAAIQAGDVLLFRPWWDDPSTAQIKQIYDQAATKPSPAR